MVATYSTKTFFAFCSKDPLIWTFFYDWGLFVRLGNLHTCINFLGNNTMVEYISTVNINPLCPWLCVNLLPSPRSNHSILSSDVIKRYCFAYETPTSPSIALGLVNALCLFRRRHELAREIPARSKAKYKSHLGIEHCSGRRQGNNVAWKLIFPTD